MNRRQAARLKQLSDYLHSERPAVHVRAARPAGAGPVAIGSATTRRPTTSVAPALMVQAIHELQDAGVEADVWKIEGIDAAEDCQKVVAAARRGGRDRVGCIILGRGEDDEKVRALADDRRRRCRGSSASRSVGPRSGIRWWTTVPVGSRARRPSRRIAASYREWVDLFETSK